MADKVDFKVLARMRELKTKYGLNNVVIGQRLGLSTRTVRAYLNGTANLTEKVSSCITPKSSTFD